jgi:hypothetical protein
VLGLGRRWRSRRPRRGPNLGAPLKPIHVPGGCASAPRPKDETGALSVSRWHHLSSANCQAQGLESDRYRSSWFWCGLVRILAINIHATRPSRFLCHEFLASLLSLVSTFCATIVCSRIASVVHCDFFSLYPYTMPALSAINRNFRLTFDVFTCNWFEARRPRMVPPRDHVVQKRAGVWSRLMRPRSPVSRRLENSSSRPPLSLSSLATTIIS